MYSVRSNARYQLTVLGISTIGLVYFFLQHGVNLTSLKALVMALAYCWGLVLAIYLMGHGLVTIPRKLFENASLAAKLRRVQERAPSVHARLEDAVQDLEQLELQVVELRKRKRGTVAEFQDWIEELAEGSSTQLRRSPSNIPPSESRSAPAVPSVITEQYLADLTRKLARARHKEVRFREGWARLVDHAVKTQSILDSAPSRRLEAGQLTGHVSIVGRLTILSPYLRYLLHYRALPVTRYVFAIILSLASLCIIWSEIIKLLSAKLSIISLTIISHSTHHPASVTFRGQVTASLWLLYMSGAVLSSINDAKVWGNRALVRGNTYGESACWYSSQIAKLTVPLAYNFITFLPADVYQHTVFYRFLGRLINLTALGKGFDYFFPVFILVPVCATLFNWYGRVANLLGYGTSDDDEDEENQAAGSAGVGTTWREGRDLIDRELSRDSGLSTFFTATRPSQHTPHRSMPPRGPAASRAAEDEEENPQENILTDFAHRLRNTFDTATAPRWMRDLAKSSAATSPNTRPRWMTSSPPQTSRGYGRVGPADGARRGVFGRLFGGVGRGEGRLRL